MRNLVLLSVGAFLIATNVALAKKIVNIKTSQGDIKVELFEKKAPLTVKNFLRYVKEKKYDGTIFHRVIDGFMIQGGGFKSGMKKVATHEPVKNEAFNGISNDTGTIAMARTSVVDSATNQFFINVNDNKMLNHRGKDPASFGYAVFGKVISGMPVVNKIKKVGTTTEGMYQNKPTKDIVIKTVEIVKK